MDLAYETNLVARILLTLATLGYGFVTMKADFNATHATNPAWTPHARFHVVWQVLSYSLIALIALGLIWIGGPMEVERLYLATGLAAAVFGGFYLALVARPLYGGTLYDENGYSPFRPPVGPSHWRWDVNVTAFTIMTAILAAGLISIRAISPEA